MAAVTGQRNTRTEARIKAAFTTLVRTKGFDSMSVSDIARTAGINRGTFYMHYTDKFDLRVSVFPGPGVSRCQHKISCSQLLKVTWGIVDLGLLPLLGPF